MSIPITTDFRRLEVKSDAVISDSCGYHWTSVENMNRHMSIHRIQHSKIVDFGKSGPGGLYTKDYLRFWNFQKKMHSVGLVGKSGSSVSVFGLFLGSKKGCFFDVFLTLFQKTKNKNHFYKNIFIKKSFYNIHMYVQNI